MRELALVYNSFFLEQLFYGNYSKSDSHTNTVISHPVALTRQDGFQNRYKAY